MEFLELLLEHIIEIAVLALEYIGVIIVIVAGIRGLICLFTKRGSTKLVLAEGFATALEFKLGSEILRTVTVQSLSEIAVVAGIIVLRVSLALLLHWEIKQEKKEAAEEGK